MNGDPISCEEVIIRLIGNKKHILPAVEAFILRPKDAGRLSFFRKAISDIDVCKTALTKPYGAATLHTGRIRATSCPNNRKLNIVEAEGEGTSIPGHAAMIGLPDPLTEFTEAERVASLLRDQSRSINLNLPSATSSHLILE